MDRNRRRRKTSVRRIYRSSNVLFRRWPTAASRNICCGSKLDASPQAARLVPQMTDLPNEAYWRDKASLLEGMSRGHGPTDPVQVMAGTLAELAQSIRTG